jgi:rhodanese-related sulfurtransferase
MKRVVMMLMVVLAVFVLVGCAGEEEPEVSSPIKLISGDEVMERLDRGEEVILVDVRTVYEHEDMRIPGSLLIPLGEYEELVPSMLPDKSAFIAVYCDVGGQSGRLVELLTEMGYTNAYQLGKLRDWHYEVERGPKE